MNVRQSIFGEIAIHSGAQVFDVDISALLRRLLLFDTVVVRSIRLREIPTLIRSFGKSGFLQLFSSGVLKISCEFTTTILDTAKNGVRTLPLSQFSFGIAQLADRDAVLRRELRVLQGVPGLGNVERIAMEETIHAGLVRPPTDYGAQLQAQIESDLRLNTPALLAATVEQIRIKFGETVPSFQLRVEEVSERTFHLVNDLPQVFGISDKDAHHILQGPVSVVANLNQRLADMAAYSAIVGFTDSEASLLFGKLSGVFAPQNPRPIEEQFARVMTIADLPDFTRGRRIDVDALLTARESVECREFRAWLSSADTLSDRQIEEMVGGLRNRVGSIVHSDKGKALRFAATTGLGLIPGAGLILGPASGAIDLFLIDKVFPNPGVLAFLTHTYPSLFKSP
jgi:hypothetical protein